MKRTCVRSPDRFQIKNTVCARWGISGDNPAEAPVGTPARIHLV
jgi:hypothetical protein